MQKGERPTFIPPTLASWIKTIQSKVLQIAKFSLPHQKSLIQLSLEQNHLLSVSVCRTSQQHGNVAEQIEDIFLGDSIFR